MTHTPKEYEKNLVVIRAAAADGFSTARLSGAQECTDRLHPPE